MAAKRLEDMNFWLTTYRLIHLVAATFSLFTCLGMMLYFNSFSTNLYTAMPAWLKELALSMNQSFGTLGYKFFWLVLAVYFLIVSYRMVSLLQEQK